MEIKDLNNLSQIVKVAELVIENDSNYKILAIVTDNDNGRYATYLQVDKEHGEVMSPVTLEYDKELLTAVADYNDWSLSKIDWE